MIADLITSTVASLHEFDISLFPNPTSDFVTIAGANQIGGTVSLLVYTPDGRQVLTYEGTGEEQIDVHTLSGGIYFVSISFDKRRFVSKLIVNR
jgi:hypothetical protein